MPAAPSMTPMFRQYHALKQQNRDSILLFRMGDFYEMFYEDAKTAARLLELTLTARGKGTDNVVPMCGFPHHQLESYTARLVRANQRVAICDQVEDPKKVKGLVKREVVRRVTPGTFNDPAELDAKAHRWMAAIARAPSRIGAAFLDATTGAFLAWEAEGVDAAAWEALGDRMRSFDPREIVVPEGFAPAAELRFAPGAGEARWTEADAMAFAPDAAGPILERQFGVKSLDGFGLRERPAAVAAAGGLMQYLLDTHECGWEHVDGIRLHDPGEALVLDASTRRNLELFRSARDGSARGALVQAIDETVTPAGGRLLRAWLGAPLLDAARIARRQDAVAELLAERAARASAREQLDGVHDIERLVARAVNGTAGPRDLAALRGSLQRVPELLATVGTLAAPLLREMLDALDPCDDVAARLAEALAEEPPALLRDGGVIRDGHHAELDELRTLQRDGKSTIAGIEARERKATGIGSLKVRFNKVFGYFLEVSKPNLHLVPPHYHRKQTIANGERFVTEELKDYETKILHAQERIESLEQELFVALRRAVAAEAPRLKALAHATARIDVLAGLAECAERRRYVRPRVVAEPVLRIEGGRHPVVEQTLADARFVPNDARFAGDDRAIAILTGPNMGGKSTYLRQVGLIVLLAQVGAFVPADEAEVGICDRIFCRVGASDNLAEGQSTFMVEMTETANILHHAGPRSLVLLDEIGRGTSTFDGLSIAWAVVEHLHRVAAHPPRTLFATHYHELTELAVELPRVFNLRMAAREWGDRVVFTHRVEEGPSDRSYGIQVARLAGIPPAVVERARAILDNLERDEFGRDGRPRRARGGRRSEADGRQPALAGLFDEASAAATPRAEEDPAAAEVLAELRRARPDAMTPLEALTRLDGWVRRLTPRETSSDRASRGPADDDAPPVSRS